MLSHICLEVFRLVEPRHIPNNFDICHLQVFEFEYDNDDDTILYIIPPIPFPCERVWPSCCLRGGESFRRARAILFLIYSFGSSWSYLVNKSSIHSNHDT